MKTNIIFIISFGYPSLAIFWLVAHTAPEGDLKIPVTGNFCWRFIVDSDSKLEEINSLHRKYLVIISVSVLLSVLCHFYS